MSLIAIICALFAALCWAITPFVSHGISLSYGAVAAVRWRMITVFIALMILSLFWGSWSNVTLHHIIFLGLSGVIGIFIGDSLLFTSLRRVGPRRNAALYATNAPMAVFLGFIIGDVIAPLALLGCFIVFAGVVLACFYGRKASGKVHPFESSIGALSIAVMIGLGSALCQALGVVIARPVLDIAQGDDLHIINATAIRVGASVACFMLWRVIQPSTTKPLKPIDMHGFGQICLSGLVGMGIAMPLFLLALRYGDAGIVASLASTSPVLVLPILWLLTKQMPHLYAWLGAMLTMIGSVFIFIFQ